MMEALPYDAPLDAYKLEANVLWSALEAGENEAAWRFKWEHPRFRGKHVSEVKKASLEPEDAELVIAQMYAFDSWHDLETFTRSVKAKPEIDRFEASVEAVVDGDLNALQSNLRNRSELAKARSPR